MKILCFIDSLGSGGAQRQLVELAKGFKEKKHEVTFLVYHDLNFFQADLEGSNIAVKLIEEPNYLKRILKIRKEIRKQKPDVVLSFLEGPNFMATLAGFPFKKWKLIVGERSANPKILTSFKLKFYRWFHLFADYVVGNSEENIRIVKSVNPFLSNRKCKVIYNLIDLNVWNSKEPHQYFKNKKLNLTVVASHQSLKNSIGLLNALKTLTAEELNKIEVNWYGDESPDESYNVLKQAINENAKELLFKLHPSTKEIIYVLENADVVGLFSLHEGLPNVLCEAMALGKPIISSRVSDIPMFLSYDTALMFNPSNTSEIAQTLKYILSLKEEKLTEYGKFNKSINSKKFDKEIIIEQFLNIMK